MMATTTRTDDPIQAAPATSDETPTDADLTERDGRKDKMWEFAKGQVEQLKEDAEAARDSDAFQAVLDAYAVGTDYSERNKRLLYWQAATRDDLELPLKRVEGFNTWKQLDRYPKDTTAMYVFAPITSKHVCPDCGNAVNYCSHEDCDADPDNSDEWDSGVVGYKPTDVYAYQQTEGEPLPELDTDARGDANGLDTAVLAVADEFGISADIVPADEWKRTANGYCLPREKTVKVQEKPNRAAVASTLIHEFAHAILRHGINDEDEEKKRECEAEATAYVVGTHFGLEMENSANYIAAWAGDETEILTDRMKRIHDTAYQIIDAVNEAWNPNGRETFWWPEMWE